MLDVAIGMVFIYMLLSLICSAINEIIEAWLKLRAVDLEQGIRELLQEQSGTSVITEKLYKHPLLFGLYRSAYDPSKIGKDNRYRWGSDLPSYIPARNFALALMDVVLPATATTASGSTSATAAPIDAAGAPLPLPNPLQPLRNAVSTSAALTGNTKIQDALYSLIDAAGNDAAKARENIENWFNSSMDRVSGWYKRRIQKFLLVLGFVLAGAVNADSFAIFKSLVDDPPLRNAIVSAAAQAPHPSDNSQTPQLRLQEAEAALVKFKLPIGWDWKSELNPTGVSNFRALPPWGVSWAFKVLGWLITGLAISLGAPFWFDLLNKVMVIRSTVKPHEKSQEESSEDRQR